VITDGLRRRERNVGRVHGNLSQTLAPTDPVRQERPVLDVLPLRGEEHQTVAQYSGVRAVVASSSLGYADALGASDPSRLPFAAIDGDPESAWQSSSFAGPRGEWLQIELDTPRVFDAVQINFVTDIRVGWPVARIRLTTDRGSVEHDVPSAEGVPHTFPVFAGPSSKLRITVLAMRGDREDGNVGIREITIPGVTASRMLRVPADAGASRRPPVLAFTRGAQPRAACVRTADELRCDARLARLGEEPTGIDRRFRLTEPATFELTGTVLARLGTTTWASPAGLLVSASSQLGGDPSVAPRMVLDGDPGTSWVADVTDQAPTLRMLWKGTRTIDRLELVRSDLAAANPPVALTLTAGDQVRRVQVGAGGTVSFEPLVTESLQIAVQSADQLPLETSGRRGASAGLAELRFPALADLVPAGSFGGPVSVPCGFGPPIEIDGKRYSTEVSGSRADVDSYRALTLTACGELGEGLALRPGEHRLRTLPTGDFVVQDLTVRPVLDAAQPVAQRRTMEVLRWDSAHRQVRVGDGEDAYLVVPENANPGWTATLDGQELRRLRVDGWQQAWLVPRGSAGVIELRFGPDSGYRTGLLIGGLAALLLVVAAAVPVRRRRDQVAAPVAAVSWWAVALSVIALLLLLGGPFPLIALLGCLLLRRVWAHALPTVAAGGAVLATTIAVAGRLAGHGQDWAFGPWAQAAGFVAVTAVIAAFLYPATQAAPDAQPR
jgi:arabinofuranan 3-O-arabinosyltransferase